MNDKYPFLYTLLCFIVVSTLVGGCSNERPGKPRVLVFSKTDGYRHKSIPAAKKAIRKLGKQHDFIVDTTENAAKFNEKNLKQYSSVIFLSTTHDVLNYRQQAAFKRYIQAGGGYIGIHAASDTEYHWPWYGKLVGAYFKEHPKVQEATLNIHRDPEFPMLDSLPNPWVHTDEWYDFRSAPENVHVLIDINQSSYKGSTMSDNHPLVWYHKFDGGRSFYMELGHTKESYSEPNFLKLLLAGIDYGIGNNEKLDYSNATQLLVPEPNRFTKEKLAGGLDEPTEMTILPNSDVLIAQRKGEISYYNRDSKKIDNVAHLDVYHDAKSSNTNGHVEMGLLGLKADPNYSKNHWVYAYYSPEGSKSVDRLSRFKFQEQQFDKSSEQIILEVPTQREICCHTGGSIAFDGDNNLYLSVGDNTTPFDEVNPKTGKRFAHNTDGYAPLDDRPGFEQYDDGRAAGNANDLRGKILRIKIKKDGSYDIPPGNLFSAEKPNTKPEIYVMGNRNPYRISIDKKTGYLYWGEVGPDAREDKMQTRGPRGYDEINQARKAGNFGWPFLIGDNYPYRHYNYATGKSGQPYNAEHPVNDSHNNDGLHTLPPAQPAFIWYPYAPSDEFPSMGSGGRTAMAGPAYYVDDFPKDSRFPEYYDGKFFAYDWMRDWVKVITMNEQGDLQTIEPFMPATKFHHISDMELGPDGRIYEVEYGNGWFSRNPEAGLYVIDYNGGNRPPIAVLEAQKNSGSVPLTIHFSGEKSEDPDKDVLSYTWDFGNGKQKTTDTPNLDYKYIFSGEYAASLTVNDGNGGQAVSHTITIIAGNERPKVQINLKGNKTFYFADRPVTYSVTVKDKEDGNSEQSEFDDSSIQFHTEYLQSPDKAAMQTGHHQEMEVMDHGKKLFQSLDCQACHKVDSKSVGPSLTQVARKYDGDSKASSYMSNKIIDGGSGVWGEVAMPAHPDLSQSDAKEIVQWILTHTKDHQSNALPVNGSFIPSNRFELTKEGMIYLIASYKDKGGSSIGSLTGKAQISLKSPLLKAAYADNKSNFSTKKGKQNHFCQLNDSKGWLKFDQISLQDVKTMMLKFGVNRSTSSVWEMQVRLDNPEEGTLLSKTTLTSSNNKDELSSKIIRIKKIDFEKLHDVYFIFNKKSNAEEGRLRISSFKLQAK